MAPRFTEKRKSILAKRRQVRVRRQVTAEVVERRPETTVFRFFCVGTRNTPGCGKSWTAEKRIPGSMADRFARYWSRNSGNAHGVCPHCTKRARDERFPLPKKDS